MKVIVFALLIVAASASVSLQAELIKKIEGWKHSMSVTPTQACADKLRNAGITESDAGDMATCMTGLISVFTGDPSSFCSGSCTALIEKMMNAVFSAECAGDYPADDRAKFRGVMGLACLKEGNEYCLPKMRSFPMISFNPFDDVRALNDTILGSTFCHPCTLAVHKALANFRLTDQASNDAMIQAGAVMKWMCEKEDNTYCFPKVLDIQKKIAIAETTAWDAADYQSNWKAVSDAVCGKTCFRKFMYGFLYEGNLAEGTKKQAYTRAMARLNVMCAPYAAGVYCVDKITEAAKNLPTTCTNPWKLGPETVISGLTCSNTCPGAINTFFNAVGCCAGLMGQGAAKGYRDVMNAYAAKCGYTLTNITSCVTRRENFALKTYSFKNLRYDYATGTNTETVKAKIAADIAASLQLEKEDITINFGQLASEGAHLFATSTSGTQATVSANCNDDQCNNAASNKDNVQFDSVNTLPAKDAAVDPSAGPSGSPQGGAAFGLTASFMAVLFALFVALF